MLTLVVINDVRYYSTMIRSFKDKETARILNREGSRKIAIDIQRSALKKLLVLHAATIIDDLKSPPGNCLEPLRGDRKGQHSIRINDQWRICFVWKDGHAEDVEIADYH